MKNQGAEVVSTDDRAAIESFLQASGGGNNIDDIDNFEDILPS